MSTRSLFVAEILSLTPSRPTSLKGCEAHRRHDVFINYIASTRSVRADLRAYLVGAICNACRNYWHSRGSEDGEGDGIAVLRNDGTGFLELYRARPAAPFGPAVKRDPMHTHGSEHSAGSPLEEVMKIATLVAVLFLSAADVRAACPGLQAG